MLCEVFNGCLAERPCSQEPRRVVVSPGRRGGEAKNLDNLPLACLAWFQLYRMKSGFDRRPVALLSLDRAAPVLELVGLDGWCTQESTSNGPLGCIVRVKPRLEE